MLDDGQNDMMTLLIEKRIKAFSIDASLATIGFFIALQTSNTNFTLGQILLWLTFFGVYVLPYFSRSGQSMGKRFQGIKIVKRNGHNVNMFLLVLRSLWIMTLSIVTAGIYIVVTTLLKNKNDELLHDLIFQTKVIILNGNKNEV